MNPSLDFETCWRAVVARDARFDGRFFTGVTSTGIYCRPVCPARTPRRENVTFHASAAAAEAGGFRACLRCRPETAPDFAGWRIDGAPSGGAWRGTSNTVSRALALIEGGALDGGDVDALAARLGVGERQLRRLFRHHLGAAPVSVAQTRRVLLAKQLIHETGLSMAQVALASGFGSVRRFNETFQGLYGRPPSALRRRSAEPGGTIRLGLSYRAPYDWPAMLESLATRSAAGETVSAEAWTRTLDPRVDGAHGRISVWRAAGGAERLTAEVEIDTLSALPGVLARARRVLDLAADPVAIASDLSTDPALADAIAARPGLRPPGDWNDPGDDLPSDRLKIEDPALRARAECWRPWRAYGALYWTLAKETPNAQAA
ncbi:Ada metal-binding domain-containing protein [Brevundimonas sp.]|uniref:bifunctional transcriptional activator/DNA repair enzyme AdaA n=1 Tax=Brevundimonas sp. TaxID=1871086 RepID=UPI0019C545BC|nr:Ada metal-binding domain-containing protein [Brevundimonas sp.]MBD3835130.1 DNA-3-methyladenine glycosylase 2 family protein [Brevundimonas sp.]